VPSQLTHKTQLNVNIKPNASQLSGSAAFQGAKAAPTQKNNPGAKLSAVAAPHHRGLGRQ